MKTFLASVLALLLVPLAAPLVARAEPLTIKVATLAPSGSSWAKSMEQWGGDVEKGTNGRVTVKFFETGEQGDERDVVRKMKLGQIDGSAITAVGLGLIKGDVRVLELPFLFRSDAELDYVRDHMAADFARQFEEAGYILITWGDVGWVHLFSNLPIVTKADLAKTKMWAWTDDPVVRAFFKRLGVNGVPLGVPDVQTSLATGTINACYGSPLAVVALKWYPYLKNATGTPFSYSIGAMVIRKEVMNKLSREDQAVLMSSGKVLGEKFKKQVRSENERAKRAMQGMGVAFNDPKKEEELVAQFAKEGQGVWDDLKGTVYSGDLLAKVVKFRDEFRAGKK
jgi:TRAP-type transport system periplasmic protein